MRVERLDRRRLPGQSRLFLQYLYDFDQVATLYPAGPAHTGREALGQRAEDARRRDSRLPREALVRMLLDFNARVGSGSATRENIEKLRDSGTVAVVTGQQLGLFGGPALSVYKALTAVSLARILEAEGCPAVPVFWLPSDDSDFLESRSTAFFGPQGSLLRLGYSGPSPPSATMVGTVLLEATGDPLKRLQDGAPVSEHREAILRTLESTYAPGRFFTDAHGREETGGSMIMPHLTVRDGQVYYPEDLQEEVAETERRAEEMVDITGVPYGAIRDIRKVR